MDNARKEPSPTVYEIKVRERLDERWREWFAPMSFIYTDDGGTVLVGSLSDQAALQGILIGLSNLNLTLVSVNPVEMNAKEIKFFTFW
ncbi:hypothetical protein KFU94_66640 [Chloroflexi bacterium TSY]|nr:hypothetical protein [Chloroflexi bacterium TSY]